MDTVLIFQPDLNISEKNKYKYEYEERYLVNTEESSSSCPYKDSLEGQTTHSRIIPTMFTSCFIFIVPRILRRKAEGHSFRLPNVVGTLCAQLLLQFYADCFETLQMFLSWSEDMHVVWI